MKFAQYASGDAFLNLDLVRNIDTQTDGTARFYFNGTEFTSIDFGSTQADARAGVEKLVQSVDSALYA